jgi:hypothetical protein
MNIEKIKEAIQSRYPEHYQGNKIDVVLEKVEKFSPALRLNLENFLQTGELQDVEILGYSISRLMKENYMNEIAAHLTMDWIFREPVKAIEGIKRGVK